MNAIVIYKSKTGFAERYACWISDELDCKKITAEEAKGLDLSSFDAVIFGGGVYAGKIAGFGKIKKRLGGDIKKLVVFAVGVANPDMTDDITAMWKSNLGIGGQNRIPAFYFQGGLDYDKMGFFSRAVMKMVAKAAAKAQKDPNKKSSPEDVSISFDATSKDSIVPLVEKVKSL